MPARAAICENIVETGTVFFADERNANKMSRFRTKSKQTKYFSISLPGSKYSSEECFRRYEVTPLVGSLKIFRPFVGRIVFPARTVHQDLEFGQCDLKRDTSANKGRDTLYCPPSLSSSPLRAISAFQLSCTIYLAYLFP